MATELERIGGKYFAAKKGYKSTAGIFTRVLQPLLGTDIIEKAFRFINSTLPDFPLMPVAQTPAGVFMGSSHLGSAEPLIRLVTKK